MLLPAWSGDASRRGVRKRLPEACGGETDVKFGTLHNFLHILGFKG